MRMIIKGKAYDTDTAQKKAEWMSDGCNGGSYRKEALYRKKTGEYFIYEEDPYRTGLNIYPITEEEAKKWAEEKANSKYEEIFGTVEE